MTSSTFHLNVGGPITGPASQWSYISLVPATVAYGENISD